MEFYNLNDLLITDDVTDLDTGEFITLPPYHSHTLIFIAVDSEKTLDNNAMYKKNVE